MQDATCRNHCVGTHLPSRYRPASRPLCRISAGEAQLEVKRLYINCTQELRDLFFDLEKSSRRVGPNRRIPITAPFNQGNASLVELGCGAREPIAQGPNRHIGRYYLLCARLQRPLRKIGRCANLHRYDRKARSLRNICQSSRFELHHKRRYITRRTQGARR